MKLRAIRRQVAYILGAVMAGLSVIWLFVVDVCGKGDVKWLFTALVCMLAGAFTCLCSYFLGNPESKNWIIFDSLAPIFGIGYAATSTICVVNNAVQFVGKHSWLNGWLNIIMMVVGIVGAIATIAALVIDIILYVKLDREGLKKMK